MFSRISKKLKLSYTWPLHLMLLPAVVLLGIFCYGPMVGLVIAFERFMPTKGFFGSPWVGLEHFKMLFEIKDIYIITRNTLIISISKIVTLYVFAIIFSLLLNEVKSNFFKKIARTTTFFPFFISWAVLGGMLISILSTEGGVVNNLLSIFGIKPIYFMGNEYWFIVVLIISNIWKEFGYPMIIIFTAIIAVDLSLYEVADLDGANRWQKMWYVTLPCIKPTIVLLAVLSLGGILNAGFDQIFNLYNVLVMDTADIIDTYVYRIGLVGAQYSFATAVGLLKSLVGFVLIVISYWAADKFANYRVL